MRPLGKGLRSFFLSFLNNVLRISWQLDMLQDKNESLLQKLHLAEERCEEAEERARLLEKQIADLGEGATLEAHLSSSKEAAQQEKEVCSFNECYYFLSSNYSARATIYRGHALIIFKHLTVQMIPALQAEAELARGETNSALQKLSKTEFEIKTLQTVTQRMMLTEEEMEEVVLKRCWLARYCSVCLYVVSINDKMLQSVIKADFLDSLRTSRFAGIQDDIASVKYEYWSSFAPLPFEIVVAAGKRRTTNNLEERQKVLKQTNELSGERNVESMLLFEKGLRELAYLKVQDAVAFKMAKQRHANMHKTEEVKMPTDCQFEAFELSQEEYEDVRFKKAWLTYFWRRAMSHGVEPDIADERLKSRINRSSQSSTSKDAVDVEHGLMEIRRLRLESQLWKTSRREPELGTTVRLHTETGFLSGMPFENRYCMTAITCNSIR
ncbi:coiled-coil domain-containing protein SCD2-like [Hibiscus syriacus]|uniref:coiled-coil domain-containing protein SCD2-like n=1 Tax=Hibiscus syriacus TaxID=106335 RepID=UPI001922ED0E|nr:coiled-coil domain-containing protein SCD2-like [Hibiscus syriacus]